ncbi:DEHA2G23386p [Debaryomyces hansenii CBS767]|uniref:Stress response regulator protein 1 n=1 Tax=Debaryomyces hansenii (strain ATCC 36239 / CBS 767 / BCRC 21394 / JCM 1990 / NBRC 0083 / IGC 2968) TaxID=284592 RepID=SRR1_DEBHA|nr:DEHA2G23386p [Debaryomyces hansenii CBS767]Q6BGW4.2 RecName: Full=Stress response regulator protein 1 [Debaryomyces hansenii CBS767]CAG91068.2 DEHA2G23386p [Debaryomyces hansenii CBS767]|eukprot:XP_462557.2 DEHA2G23386p [Debaryomyces hansenii CBS767]
MDQVQFDFDSKSSCSTQTRHSANIFNKTNNMIYNNQLGTPPALPSPDYDYRMDYFHYKPVSGDVRDESADMVEAEYVDCDLKPKLSVDVNTFGGNQQFISPIELGEYKKFTPNTNPYNFLLVDDNFINLKILERVLLKLYPNCTIVKTQDSTKIMALLHSQTFDVAFLDIEMPGLTGIELAKMIRMEDKLNQVGIIAVTTKSLPCDKIIYEQAGIDHTFAKPLNYSFDHIITCIEKVLRAKI